MSMKTETRLPILSDSPERFSQLRDIHVPQSAPSRALVLKARIVQRKEALLSAIAADSPASRLAEIQRAQAEDEREYRQLIDNQ